MKHVIVVGGGITGLSAAYYLQRMAANQGVTLRITLLEQTNRLGGKIETIRRDGFQIEKGPDSFLARKLPMIDLARELGMEDDLVATNPKAKKTYILRRQTLHRMPPGLMLGIPTELTPFMKTGLISWRGKARAAMDLVLPRREGCSDESLGEFLTRRLGREVVDQIAEPLLAGIYAGDTYALSLQATFPQFQAVEQKYRSLILGMRASKRESQITSLTEGSGKPRLAASDGKPSSIPAIAKNSVFLSYRHGLESLVEKLEETLIGVDIRKGVRAERIVLSNVGPQLHLKLADGDVIEADAILLTVPLYAIGKLVGGSPAIDRLSALPYVSVANVIMGFDAHDITHPLDGSGFVVPREEGRFITACTWTSSKWDHTAPSTNVLLRCYVGRSGDERWMGLTDEDITNKVLSDLRELMGINAKPMFVEVTRWHQSMPQYPVGHLEHVKQARAELTERLPGVYMSGAAFHGVGLPDCIRQGKEAATQVVDFVSLT